MGKRSAKFLGSQMWRNRDVRVDKIKDGAAITSVKVTDLPSGISIFSSHEIHEGNLLRKLAHRVHQFE